MTNQEFSKLVFAQQDVSVLAYRDGVSPKPNIVVDYEGLEVTVYTSPTDGKLVIQVEPVNEKQLQNLRVQVEDQVVKRGTVSNISNPTDTNQFTVLFDDGQTHMKDK